MKLLDYSDHNTRPIRVNMSFFMEGALPEKLDRDILDLANDCLIARPYFTNSYATGGKVAFIPNNRQEANRWPLYSAWQEVDTYYGKRVLPKVKVNRYADAVAIPTALTRSQHLRSCLSMILWGRTCDPVNVLDNWETTAASYCPSLDAQGRPIFAEYDFGAEVTLESFTTQCAHSTNVLANPFFVNTATCLQAKIEDEWVTVSSVIPFNGGVLNETKIPVSLEDKPVTAQHWRIYGTSETQTYAKNYQVVPFAVYFYGEYVEESPRTFAKMGHMIMTPFSYATSSTFQPNGTMGTQCTFNITSANYLTLLDDHFVAQSAYSLTDNPKQIADFDLFIPTGLTFEQGSDFFPPFFVADLPVTELEAL